ncbi:MAG: hypothetical protein ACK5KN_00275 [Dysgonomonas sp.]|uniref:hypothetical protein n=1 Tax=Dysgonomonas sp. TaxID=1891233 RepID=UPI003A86B68D
MNESNNNNITVETLNNSSAKPEDSATENQMQDVSNSPEVNKSADSPNDFLQSDSIKNEEAYKNNYNGNYYILATVPNVTKTAVVITNESYNLSNDYGSDSYIQNEFYGDYPISYDTYYYEEYYPIHISNNYEDTDYYDDNYYYPSYPTYPNHRPNRPRPPHKPKPPVRPEPPIIKPEPPVRPQPPIQPQPPTDDIRTSERPKPESTSEVRTSERPVPESNRKLENTDINRPSQSIISNLQERERYEAESRRQREQQERQEQERRETESRRQREQQEKQDQERREAENRRQREQQEQRERQERERQNTESSRRR